MTEPSPAETTVVINGGFPAEAAPPAPPAPAPAAVAPAAPAPAASPSASAPERIICPECGTAAVVTLNRRDSADFCRQCDFPLFWTPTAIVRDDAARLSDESLRRLPGTVGRVTVASIPCPHCAEPNLLSAQTCVRCGLPMRVIAAAQEPQPVYVAPPPAEPEPEKRVPWWVWAMIAIIAGATIVLVVLGATGTIGG